MKEKVHYLFLTPKGVFQEGECQELLVDTKEGPRGISPNHDTFLASIPKNGVIEIRKKERETIVSEDGLLLVEPERVLIWSVSFIKRQ